MAKGDVTKVMKFELRYLGGFPDFHTVQQALWDLQRKTREILNRTVQMVWHWDYLNRKHWEETGENLDIVRETGYKRYDGCIYNELKVLYPEFAGQNLIATIQKAWKKYGDSKKDILRGDMSIPSYKSDQPIVLNKGSVRLFEDGRGTGATLTLFSNAYKKERQVSNVEFAVHLHDGTQRAIFRNLLNRTYALGQSQLVYDRKKWFLLLTYSFTPAGHALDPDRILGVDLGETYALYASSCGNYGSLKIEGGEVTAFARSLERRRQSMQQQARCCGEGRIGHGARTRVSAVYRTDDKIAAFRDTVNHRYSRALIEYAVKNGYGTIQMEDLSGIKAQTGFPKKLRHWTYYDLQNKIASKAKEHGIAVVRVRPAYTSRRCSRCGYIDEANRPSQEKFCCGKCGFSANADYNASQNLSIAKIDDIIEKTVSAKQEQS